MACNRLTGRVARRFGDDVAIEQVKDPGNTGNFEVTCAGTLVHSKATKDQGKCQTGEETQLVIDAIQEAVDAA